MDGSLAYAPERTGAHPGRDLCPPEVARRSPILVVSISFSASGYTSNRQKALMFFHAGNRAKVPEPKAPDHGAFARDAKISKGWFPPLSQARCSAFAGEVPIVPRLWL